MKTFKTIIALLTIVFLATGTAWADTDGTGYTNPSFDWGDYTSGNGGLGDVNVSGSYSLDGATAEGYANVTGYVGGSTTIESVDENGFISNSSYGFLEASADIQNISGTGTLDASIDGSLKNSSEMGESLSAQQNVQLDSYSETSESSLSGDLRLQGHTFTSEKEEESYQIGVAGSYTDLKGSEGLDATASADLSAQGESLKTTEGITSVGNFSCDSNLDIQKGEYAETYGESLSIANSDEKGSYGEVKITSYSKTGTIPTDTQ